MACPKSAMISRSISMMQVAWVIAGMCEQAVARPWRWFVLSGHPSGVHTMCAYDVCVGHSGVST